MFIVHFPQSITDGKKDMQDTYQRVVSQMQCVYNLLSPFFRLATPPTAPVGLLSPPAAAAAADTDALLPFSLAAGWRGPLLVTDDELVEVCIPFSFVAAVLLPFSRERELEVVDGCNAMLFDGESWRGSLTSTTESNPPDVVLVFDTGFEDMVAVLAGAVVSDVEGAREEEGMLWLCPVDDDGS